MGGELLRMGVIWRARMSERDLEGRGICRKSATKT